MKQKKSTKDINPPSSDEINASNVCRQLDLSFKKFQQLNSNEEFQPFIQHFTTFLNEETNMKLLIYFSPMVIMSIIDHIMSIEFDSNLANQIFSFINLIIIKMGIIFPASTFTTFFLFLANGENERLKILTDNEKTILDIFSDEIFFDDFINNNLFIFIFQKLFLSVGSKEICAFYSHIIFTVAPINLLTSYDYQPIINILQNQSQESTSSETALFITHLFPLNDKYQYFFNDKNNFSILAKLLSNASFDTIIQCFQYLIFIEPPNFDILKNVVTFYHNNVKIQDQFFVWIFEFVKSNPDIVTEVNSIVPFSNWVAPKTPVSKLLNAMKLMNSIHPSLVSQFLSLYFSLLCKEESDINSYLCGVSIIESQIFHRRISLTFLLNSLFLNAFIVKPSIDMLNEIFQKSYTFPQLVYDIYALPDAKPIRQEVLGKIIQVSLKNRDLTPIVSAFLVISDSCENLREMMDLIETSKAGHLCDALCSAFSKSDTLTVNFLKEYGMKWIDSIFQSKIIDIEMVKHLTMGLTSRVNVQIVDDFIESLPPDHPLFKLEPDDIRSLVYGSDDPPVYYPIRVYSLFHLIPCPWSIDPYNSVVIGKHVLRKYKESPIDLPIIAEIGNRYITSDTFYEIMKSPSQLDQFANKANYDHFPLFQVFEYTEEKVFDIEFNSISFWFKFQSKIDDSLKIPFFHASKFHLFLKKNNLIANYEGTEYEVPINPLNWNHVFVSISPSLISHKIKIWVNLSKAVFTSPTKLNSLSNFGFLVYATYLYIGPSVRLYKDKCVELNKLFELGPSSLEKLNEDYILTPFSKEIQGDKNILAVEYNGFPAHFKSRSKLNYFFEILRKTENEGEFENLLNLFYKVYLIMKNAIDDLFTCLLDFFCSVPSRLTKDRLINVLTFFGKHKSQKVLLGEILRNSNFWDVLSNDIIIYSIVSYFKTFDFCEDYDNFQFFLAKRLIFNQTSKYIMTSFLVNSKPLPKCQKCLLALFLCHHFMYRRKNRSIQCTLKSSKNMKIELIENSEDTIQYFQLVDRKSMSIQCDLEFDDSACFDEQLLLFNEVWNTELQFSLIDCFCGYIKRSGTIENIKSVLQMEDLLSLFIVSQNKFKASLFKLFVLIEKMSPGFIVINNLFLTAFFPLFVYQSVWDETMSLISDDGLTVTNASSVSLMFALVWSLTVCSLHSVARRGQNISPSFEKEVRFCSSNCAAFAANKNAQSFMRTWYPMVLGFVNDKGDAPTNSVRLESIEITPPKVSTFSNNVWESVIESARDFDNDLPLKTVNFYEKEFKEFISKSELLLFLFNILLSSDEGQFIHLFSPFLLIPTISEKKISEVFLGEFTTNFLTYLSQTFSIEMPFIQFLPVLHCLNNYGFLKSNFQFILSGIFVIISLLNDLHNKLFKKFVNLLNNLLIDLFSNCEKDSFCLLFNILQQHVMLFIEITKVTNTLDCYLCFFQKVASNCYKEFDAFFKKFLNLSEIDQSSKQVQDLLHHVELDDENQLNKWNKILSLSNSAIKPVKGEINECYTSMMIELTENTKEFSITYYISVKRQQAFSDTLEKRFDSLENFQSSEKKFKDSIKLIQESTVNSITTKLNEPQSNQTVTRKLIPFSFPFSLPRLFVPIAIQSQEKVLDFIKEQKLYTGEIASFEQLEKISLPKKRGFDLSAKQKVAQKGTSLSSLSSSNDELNVKRRSNSLRPISSSPLPRRRADEIELNRKKNHLTGSQLFESINGSDDSSQAIPLSASASSSSLLPIKAQFEPIIFNCQLDRFNYSIPTVVSVSSNNLRLIPFCRYDPDSSLLALSSNSVTDPYLNAGQAGLSSSSPRGNSSLDLVFVSKFVADVINGFWGETQLFEKRIVIKIPLNTIFFISRKSENCFAFWTQKSGTFILNKVENDIFTKIPFSAMNPLSSIERVEDKSEVIEKWFEGLLSTSQMIVALNISEGRNYVDLRNFVKFPDAFTIFGTFSPINESLAANLTEGLMIGNLQYSNSIELNENDQSIIEFIKKFNLSENLDRKRQKVKSLFSINGKIYCQKISGIVPKWSLFDNQAIASDLPELSVRISPIYPFYAIIEKEEMAISLFDNNSKEKIFSFYSKDFCTAKSLSVSQNFIFLSVDFVSNVTYVYRILYDMGLPSKIEFIRENSFLSNQKTTVNGSELLAGTFSRKAVYIWPLYRFSYHRIINFENEIRFCQFDDNAGTFWVCDKFSCFLFDCNGQLFSSFKFGKTISAFNVVPKPILMCDRSVICGFDDGSVAIVEPMIESGLIRMKELNHVHNSKIVRITFHPMNTYFMTIDICQNAYFWSQKNVDGSIQEFDIEAFCNCPLCGKKPFKLCLSCKRAFCATCLNDNSICPDCLSTE